MTFRSEYSTWKAELERQPRLPMTKRLSAWFSRWIKGEA